ncbi:MAG: hypothetical protein HOB82_06690 [Alphaproteobacteria bacterium]|nr:hypothetical protein [Alphaproteobacteria bacterium]
MASVAVLVGIAVIIARNWPSNAVWASLATPSSLRSAALAGGLIAASILVRGVRWHGQLRGAVEAPMGRMLAGFAWCFVVVITLPLRLGEAARVLWARRVHGDSGHVAGALIAERLTDLLALAALAGFAALVVPDSGPGLVVGGGIVLAISLGMFAVASVFSTPLSTWVANFANRPRLRGRVGPILSRASNGLATIAPGSAIRMLGLGLIAWILNAAAITVFLIEIIPGLPWPTGVAVLVSVNLAALVNVVPANVGLYHSAAIVALLANSVPFDQALVAATGLHALSILTIFIVGGMAKIYLARFGQRIWDVV